MDPIQKKEVRQIVQHIYTNITKPARSKRDSQQTRLHDDYQILTTAIGFYYPTLAYEGLYNRLESFLMSR